MGPTNRDFPLRQGSSGASSRLGETHLAPESVSGSSFPPRHSVPLAEEPLADRPTHPGPGPGSSPREHTRGSLKSDLPVSLGSEVNSSRKRASRVRTRFHTPTNVKTRCPTPYKPDSVSSALTLLVAPGRPCTCALTPRHPDGHAPTSRVVRVPSSRLVSVSSRKTVATPTPTPFGPGPGYGSAGEESDRGGRTPESFTPNQRGRAGTPDLHPCPDTRGRLHSRARPALSSGRLRRGSGPRGARPGTDPRKSWI